jgi:hypothetical protein
MLGAKRCEHCLEDNYAIKGPIEASGCRRRKCSLIGKWSLSEV